MKLQTPCQVRNAFDFVFSFILFKFQFTDTAGVQFITKKGDGSQNEHQIVGETEETKKAHVVRAALLAMVDIVKDQALSLQKDAPKAKVFGVSSEKLPPIRIDGGCSRSDFICQGIANVLQRDVERFDDVEASVRGTGMLAGLGNGVYSSISQVQDLVNGSKSKLFTSTTSS